MSANLDQIYHQIQHKLDLLIYGQSRIFTELKIIMNTAQQELDTLNAEITAQETLNASINTFLDGLPAVIAAAMASNGVDPAAIAATSATLKTSMDATQAKLTAAMTANTAVTPAVAASTP